MPPRLPSLISGPSGSPTAVLGHLARPFSTTPAILRTNNNGAANILSLDQNQTSQPAERVQNLVRERARAKAESNQARQRAETQQLRDRKISDDYIRQMPRRWREGEVYAPKDLNPVQLNKFKRWKPPSQDVTDVLSVNPLDLYRNFAVMSEFMTPAGQIKGARDTGLRPRNQRRMAKAIRRVIGMGIHPSVHEHPEILKKKMRGNI